MTEAIKLNKKTGELETSIFPKVILPQQSLQDSKRWMLLIMEYFYPRNEYPSLYRKFVSNEFNNFPFIVNTLPNGDIQVFKNTEVLEKLGLSYTYEGRTKKAKKGEEGKLVGSTNLKQSGYQPYNLQTSDKEYSRGTISNTFNITKGLKYTFGVEIETSGGSLPLPVALLNELNVQCIRDGSITGGEYVTGVLIGDAGFIQLNKLVSLLRETTIIDKKCGVHVHIGGANFNKAFTVFAFILGLRMEEELFKTLPESRQNNRYCDYLSKLPTPPLDQLCNIITKYGFEAGVDMVYDILYEKMSYGDKPDRNHNKLSKHKHGRYCGQYGGIQMEDNFRYKWLNLIPLNFNMKNAESLEEVNSKATIEFRNHSASLSYVKIKNWALFCMSFVNYVENYKDRIINLDYTINLPVLLSTTYQEKSNKLINYFEERKSTFNTKNGTKVEAEEYLNNNEQVVKTKKEIICV